ncbi:MAG TPA: hypothetical protein VGS27_18375 [Candidatus Sulfotelmatobacter sp.]|nr:hypothetical protein [Candidatus Sulfotelmatobacter sp.]
MKRVVGFIFASLFFAVPMLVAQNGGEQKTEHAEVGIFAEYLRFTDPGPTSNYIGLGGRAAFNVRPSIQLEAEMGYDFERNYTNTYTNGVNSATVASRLRVLHGLFGPKFQTGSGPVRFFVTGKVGFENFMVTGQGAPTGFASAVGLANGATYFSLYPGGGIEAFAGPIGIRAEIGDDIFFNSGMHNNMRISFGPQFRF